MYVVDEQRSEMADMTNPYARYTPRDRSLRASDHDRDAVGDFLRRQHVAGRLDTDEFAERYGRCLQAKTYAQLDELITDLPPDAEPVFAGGPAAPQGGWWDNGAWSGGPWGNGAWSAGPPGGGPSGNGPWRRRPASLAPPRAHLARRGCGPGLDHRWALALDRLPAFLLPRPAPVGLAFDGAARRRWEGPWGCHSGFVGRGSTTL